MLLAVAGFTAWQALQVRSSLDVVATELAAAADQLADDDISAADASVTEAADAADRAHRHSSGPVWWLGSRLPWVGDDVTAVRVVSAVADSLASDTLPDMVAAVDAFGPDALQPRDGRIRLEPIAEVAPRLRDGAGRIADAQGRVAALDTDGLVAALSGPVLDLADKLDRAASLSDTAATVAEVLPSMLAAGGERHYLMVFQTNAEIRALGGMYGAHALMRVRDGRPEMVSQGRPGQLGTFERDFIDLTEEERALYTWRLSTFPQSASFIPDFPRSSQILTRMWEERRPERLDGMLSVDPVALGYLLSATGPITLDNGERLTADNAADYLLNGIYLTEPDTALQNTLFEEAARKTFDALLGGGVDAKALVDALGRASGERRLMVWSAHEEEQERFAGRAISGALPTAPTQTPEIGVYLNDAAADKLSYYLDYAVDVTPRSCGSTGAQIIDVDVTLTNTVPPGQALPPSIIGPGLEEGVEPGTLRNAMSVYGPVSGAIVSATLDETEAPMQELTHHGRPVGAVAFDLSPGQTRTLSFEVRTPADQTGDPRLLTTPASRTLGVGEVAGSAC